MTTSKHDHDLKCVDCGQGHYVEADTWRTLLRNMNVVCVACPVEVQEPIKWAAESEEVE